MNHLNLKAVLLVVSTLSLHACDPQKIDNDSLSTESGSSGNFDITQDNYTNGDIESANLEMIIVPGVTQGENGTGSFNDPLTLSYNRTYTVSWKSNTTAESRYIINLYSIDDPNVTVAMTEASCDANGCDNASISCYFLGTNGRLDSGMARCSLEGGVDDSVIGGVSMVNIALGLGRSVEEIPLDAGIRLDLCDASGTTCDTANLGYVTLKLEDQL